MNIMIISQSLTGGGAEKVAANLSLGLKDSDNVILLTYQKDLREYYHAGKRINISSNSNSLLGKFFQAIKRIVLIAYYKNKYQIDKAISFVPQCDYPNIISSFFTECVAIIEVSSNSSIAFTGYFGRIIRKYIISKASKIVVVSNGIRQDLINNWHLPSNKITTIFNSVDIGYIQNAKQQHCSEIIEGEYIIAMGSFRKPKGHWHLIKAFAAVRNKLHTDCKLLILGDGPYRDKYCELMNVLGLDDSIVMPGFVENPFAYIAKSQFMVFSSVYEGFGNAIIEAMVCGVPVISSDCDFGPREIIAPDTDYRKKTNGIEICKFGILTTPFDMSDIDVSRSFSKAEADLSDAICVLIENKNLRESLLKEASLYVKKFSNDVFTSNWQKVLSQNE